jgi:chitodextrinase
MASATWGTPPLDTTAPSAPTNLVAAAASRSQINLSWGAATDNLGVAGYYVYRNGIRVGTATTTSFNDKTVKANTTYCYVVTAFDGLATNPFSNTACATTPRR